MQNCQQPFIHSVSGNFTAYVKIQWETSIGYTILSNREGGKGRSDLQLKPIRKSREAFVIEFKVIKNIDEINQKADEAIQQIEDKKYGMELRKDGYKHISYYGIAFCGKECAVHCC